MKVIDTCGVGVGSTFLRNKLLLRKKLGWNIMVTTRDNHGYFGDF